MARTKKTVVSGITREQAEQAFADFAAADAQVQNLTSKMDIEMTRIREKYADQLAELSVVKEKNFDIMQSYALENKEELFSKKKSLESAHGVFGFRTGTPKLKNLKGFTWAAVTNLCKELLPQYIRTSEELAKDRLLADRDNPEMAQAVKNPVARFWQKQKIKRDYAKAARAAGQTAQGAASATKTTAAAANCLLYTSDAADE